MSSEETAAPEAPDPQTRVSYGFVRCLWAMALGAAAVAVFRWERVAIDQPGALPLVLLAAALLLAGPPKRAAKTSRAARAAIAIAIAAFAWCAAGAFGLAEEREAALLTLPNWSFAAGLAVLGWCLRQTGRPFVVAGLVAMAVCRVAASAMQGFHPEAVWWTATLLWACAVLVGSKQLSGKAPESPPLIAGVFWFVLLVSALTVQEFRTPFAAFGASDDRSAVAAVLEKPATGFGSGSFERVINEYTIRSPELSKRPPDDDETMARAQWATRAVLRLAAEIGLPALLAMMLALVLAAGSSVRTRPWTRERVACFGAMGFWLAGMLSMRTSSPLAVGVLAFLVPAAMGRAETASDETPATKRFAFEPWGVALAVVLVPAILFPFARWQWQRQDPASNIEAKSFLSAWSAPLRSQAVTIRARSTEIAKYADPRDFLEPVAKRWLAASPRDELALFEWVRLAERTGGRKASEEAALEAHRRLPWEPAFPLWAVRMRVEEGRIDEAIEFLDDLNQRQQPLHHAVRERRMKLRRERE